MSKFIYSGIITLLFLFTSPHSSKAQQEFQENPSNSEAKNIEIGLALSGGGAKGFAHIGVLKVLEEEGIPVHMVSGTSMGAIIGSLYSIGYSPQEIETIAKSSNWNILFNDNYQINPQQISNSVLKKNDFLLTFPFNGKRITLPTGLIDGQNISMLLYRLMLPFHDVEDFTTLPIPFSSVATNLSTGESKTFTSGYLPDAVRASIAIPSIFKPVTINGETYIDGGVARNIPVEDVRQLGADVVIASDVGEPIRNIDSLNTFVDVLFQSVGFHQQESDSLQKNKTDIYIRPDISKFSTFSYEQTEEIIKRGEQAARKALPDIKALLQERQLKESSFKPIRSTRQETVTISDVQFVNLNGLTQQQQIFLALNIKLPSTLKLSQLEQKINKLYGSGLFSQISYRLQKDSSGPGDQLILSFQHKEQEYVGFSMRYDSEHKAALLFGASLTDNLFWNDRLLLQLRVGEILELNSDYSIPISIAPLAYIKSGLNIQRSPINYYNDDQILASVDVEKLSIKASTAVQLWQQVDLETGIENEFYNLNEAIGNTLVFGNTDLLINPFVSLNFNTLNRPFFPTRGHSLQLKSEISDSFWGSSSTFFQLSGKWFSTLKLLPGLNVSNQLFMGYSSSSSLPLHYYYYLGGLSQNPVFDLKQLPFMGYAIQQLRAPNTMAIRSKLQLRLNKRLYLTGGANIAHLSDQWTFNIDRQRLHYGYSLTFGANSIIGPIEVALSTPNFSSGYALKLNVGYHF